MITTVYAARAHFVGGSIHDLIFFLDEFDAHKYKRSLSPLPLGFERIDIVPLEVIGGEMPQQMKRRPPPRRHKRAS